MASVRFEYDPWRGGFCVRLGPVKGDRCTRAIGGLVSIFSDAAGQIVAVESYWDHGGLPLRGVHQTGSYPQGTYSIDGDERAIGPIRFRQKAARLELWFGPGEQLPPDESDLLDDAGVSLWLSHQAAPAGWPVPGLPGRADCRLVAGLTVEFARSVAKYPIVELVLSAEDFK